MKPRPNHVLKKFAGLLGMLAVLQTAQAQFTYPVYEPFSEYVQGENLRAAGSSGNFWNAGNSANGSQIITTNAALSYIGLQPDPGATPMGVSGPTGVGRTATASFTAQNSGTVYASVLINLKSYPSGNRAIFGLSSTTTGTPNPGAGSAAVWVNSSGQLMLSKNSSTTPNAAQTTAVLALNTTHLVVISYTFVASATTNDPVSLWLDPVALGNNGNVPAATLSTTNYSGAGADSTSIGAVALYAPSSTPTMQTFYDEIRIDNNWAGVTPSAPSPGPSFTVGGGGAGCPGNSFLITLSGSVTTNVYFLYTNSVYTGVSVNGTGSAIDFGPQNTTAIYTVVASNTVSSNQGYMNGSATITVLDPPTIATQPNSVVVAANGLATFTLTANGSGLKYQWYRNNGVGLSNGGNISGAQTPTLTVYPATVADQGTTNTGYYCIITNNCAAVVISTTNALTIDSPVNVVWQGGNPNTNWDTGATLNWTNSAGAARVFNAGDNVTFDDSSTNPIVTITGISVAPSVISEVAAQNYFITPGSSPIAGPGSLVMSGTGTLAISNANTFTGGTVINSGIVSVRDVNQQALGTGPVTMAGGKLDIALKSGVATIGLTNNLNVTANSILQYDGAGSIAFDLFGGINGSPSAVLTIQGFLNNSGTPDRMRLYGIFTNNARIAINTAGDEVELAPYLTTGAQLYNGVISGIGGRFTLRGAGQAIFAGANTFNDTGVNANGAGPSGYSILISGGNLGIGADSSPDFLPVANGGPTGTSPLGTGILGINNSSSEGGNASIFAYGGAHSVSNSIIYTTATNTFSVLITGSNNLTLAGPVNLNGADSTGGTNRVWNVSNTGLTTISGIIDDATLICGLTKSGAGRLALNAANTYTGPTLVSAGVLYVNGSLSSSSTVTATNGSLGGTGTISGATTVSQTGVLAPGTAAIGTLTINNNLTLSGNAVFKVNKSLSPGQSNDIASVSGSLSASGTGTLTVSNLGPAIVVGDRFKVFSGAVSGGAALTVTGAGIVWTNQLALDGSISALAVASTVNTNPAPIVFYQTNSSSLALFWPPDRIGWRLIVQTNPLSTGLLPATNNWSTVPGSTTVSNVIVPANTTSGTVFYRLIYP